ncbi:MAG: S1C family serine protease [Candidatus Caldarchaeum sp.]
MTRTSMFYSIVLAFLFTAVAYPQSVGRKLQAISVNVSAGTSQGSGTIFIKEIEGVQLTFILTAYHVISGLRKVETRMVDGKEEKRAVYNDAEITQEVFQDGRKVGKVTYAAKVICVDSRRDLALLLLRKEGKVFEDSGVLYTSDEIPDVGTNVLHAGSPGGLEIGGSATVTSGIISRVGVTISEFGGSDFGVFDQTTCPALPGSSGGLIAKADTGEIVGVLTIGLRSSTGFNWMVPTRTIKKWLDEANMSWFYNDKVDKPRLSDLRKLQVIEVGGGEIKSGSFNSTEQQALPSVRVAVPGLDGVGPAILY